MTYIYLLACVIIAIVLGYVKFTYKIDHRLSPVIKLCICIKQLTKNPNDIKSRLASIDIQY